MSDNYQHSSPLRRKEAKRNTREADKTQERVVNEFRCAGKRRHFPVAGPIRQNSSVTSLRQRRARGCVIVNGGDKRGLGLRDAWNLRNLAAGGY